MIFLFLTPAPPVPGQCTDPIGHHRRPRHAGHTTPRRIHIGHADMTMTTPHVDGHRHIGHDGDGHCYAVHRHVCHGDGHFAVRLHNTGHVGHARPIWNVCRHRPVYFVILD